MPKAGLMGFTVTLSADGAPSERDGQNAAMSTISLVTGANRGIGREVCRQLAELGHTVILTARDPSAEPLQLDVTDPASVTRAARWTQERHGKLDVLVNNAAITYDTWQR